MSVSDSKKIRGQSALEYILLIGGAVLISVVVLSISIPFFSGTGSNILVNNIEGYSNQVSLNSYSGGSSGDTTSVCGDGTLDLGEACDDGDVLPNDGCNSTCQVESGWTCVSEPSVCTANPPPSCGDGILDAGETCDPPQLVCIPVYASSCSYCDAACQTTTIQGPKCGDNVVNGPEVCDGSVPPAVTCVTQGFDEGTISCSSSCTYDTSACTSYTYEYGAYLEPPVGKIIEGMGQWAIDNPLYLSKATSMGGLLPMHESLYFNIAASEAPADKPIKSASVMAGQFNAIDAKGEIPEIGIQFYDFSPPAGSLYQYTSHDDLVALETKPDYEAQVRRIGAALAIFDKPVFLKIGWEFNNKDNPSPPNPTKGAQAYHSTFFPIAYNKTRNWILDEYSKAGKTPKVAWVWAWEAAATTDYLDNNSQTGQPLWYPGDASVDWFGVDYFPVNDFTSQSGPPPFGPSHLIALNAFLDKAKAKGKPVHLTETSEVNIDVPGGSTDTSGVWNFWFVPWLSYLDAHPEIKSFSYIDHNWTGGNGGPATWKDGRRYTNDEIMQKWLNEMNDPKYLHAGEMSVLNGYSNP